MKLEVSDRLPLRLLVLASVGIAYWTAYAPSRWVLATGLRALDYPPYRGFIGLFLPHLLLYSTLTALCCAVLWFILFRIRAIGPVQLKSDGAWLLLGIAGGIAALLMILAAVIITGPAGSVHWVGFSGWKIAGNLFSNLYEEFIFRGFILTALTAVLGFWPAAVISSVLWGAEHHQYPLALQGVVAAVGIVWSWIARKAKSLWAPYISHMLLDIVGDAIIP